MPQNVCDTQKIVPIIFTQAIVDNDDPVGAYGDANPVTVDTKGAGQLDIYVEVGATDIAMTALGVYEGDVVASGADDSDFTLVPGAAFTGGDLPSATDDNNVWRFSINLANSSRKRYYCLDATAGNGATGTFIKAWAVLSRLDQHPSTAAERGLEAEIHIG